jgi:hypothetical protein
LRTLFHRNGVDASLYEGSFDGIPVLALARPLGAYAASHGVFLHGPLPSRENSGHWNELGHAQAGHAITRELVAHSPAVPGVDARHLQ